jgi:hypothetical protein
MVCLRTICLDTLHKGDINDIIIIIIITFSCLLFQNIVVGIGGAMLSCIGDLTNKKQEALLFLTVSILTINVVNIVILEVGEWHFFMTSNIQEIIGQKNLKKRVFYGIVYLWSILR